MQIYSQSECLTDRFVWSQSTNNHKRKKFLSRFYARKQVLLSARFSHRNSVCTSVWPSVRHTGGSLDQSKTVQARIIKSSPSAAGRL